MIYFLFRPLFKLVASSFCKKVADLYEQRSRRVSLILGPKSYRDFRETGPRSENRCENDIFGLKQGQDLENWMAHPHLLRGL